MGNEAVRKKINPFTEEFAQLAPPFAKGKAAAVPRSLSPELFLKTAYTASSRPVIRTAGRLDRFRGFHQKVGGVQQSERAWPAASYP